MAEQKVNWDAKNKREFFCKSANSQIINGIKDIKDILKTAQIIVDKAWDLYPSENDNKVEIPE